jgi:glycosyltransferase involved in cell wall biosynthesis
MKILLLVKNFDFGGAENHVCELANELIDQGEQVWLLSGTGRQLKRLSPKVQHFPALFAEWNTVPLFFQLASIIKREKIELIHAHQRLPIFLATLVGLFTRTKVVGTIHGRASHDIRSAFVRRNLSSIIVISKNSFDIHIRNPAFRDRIHLLPNCFNIPGGPQPNEAVKSPPFRMFYVSRQDQRHSGLLSNILLNVWPQFLLKYPGSLFHIVGDGDASNKVGRILEEHKAGPWADSVVCHGFVEDVSSCIRSAHLVLGVGRVVGQSLCMGVPAISIKWNHLGPILTRDNFDELSYANFVSLSAPPPDSEHLLALLSTFMDHSAFYQSESLHLQKSAAKNFDIREGVLQTRAVYRKLVSAVKF